MISELRKMLSELDNPNRVQMMAAFNNEEYCIHIQDGKFLSCFHYAQPGHKVLETAGYWTYGEIVT